MRTSRNEIEAQHTTITGGRFTDRGVPSVRFDIASPYFKNEQDAILFASMFPKSIRARKICLGGLDIGVVWFVVIMVRNTPGATQGEKNETGRTRLLRALRILKKNGVEVVSRVETWNGEPLSCAIGHAELHEEVLRFV